MIRRALAAAAIITLAAWPASAGMDVMQGVYSANTSGIVVKDDNGSVAPAHTLVNEFGDPIGVAGNPVVVKLDPAPANLAKETGGNLARVADQTAAGGPLSVSGSLTNPISVLTRPNNTTAYAQNDLIADNTTAGSITVPAFDIQNDEGGAVIKRVRLATNATTGWDGAQLRVRLFSMPPTYANGDNGAYALATGSGSYLGRFDVTLEQAGDGAMGVAGQAQGDGIYLSLNLVGGVAVYWDMQILSAGGLTPIAQQTFILTPELQN